jgi:hypothetical protein
MHWQSERRNHSVLNFPCCDTTVSSQDTHSQSGNGIQTEVDKKITQTLKTIGIFYFAPAFFGWVIMHLAHPKKFLGGPWPTQNTVWRPPCATHPDCLPVKSGAPSVGLQILSSFLQSVLFRFYDRVVKVRVRLPEQGVDPASPSFEVCKMSG